MTRAMGRGAGRLGAPPGRRRRRGVSGGQHEDELTGMPRRADERPSNERTDERRGKRRGGLRRSLGWLAFLPVASRVPTYSRLVWALVRDERIPTSRKALLLGAAGYLLAGRDLIPDDIPVLGGLDDLAVVVLAVDIFLEGVPEAIIAEQLDELGIDRQAFDRDMAQIRRLTPGPLRRVLRRLPLAVDAAGRVVHWSGVGPRLRGWIDKEDPYA